MRRACFFVVSLASFASIASLSVVGCSSSSSPSTASDASTSEDAGTDGVAPDAAPGTIYERGRILDYGSMTPLKGVTVTIGSLSVQTGADGKWAVPIPMGTPVRAKITDTGYIDVHLPELSGTGDVQRADVPIPDLMTFMYGQYAQPGYDTTKASVSVHIDKFSSCASIEGATLTVMTPAAGAKVEYFKGGFPSPMATSVSAAETGGHVSVYNVDPTADIVFQLSHPTCTQAPFPVTDGTQTLTGKVTLEAGNANSVFIMYLK
jgi:hypothetical protein